MEWNVQQNRTRQLLNRTHHIRNNLTVEKNCNTLPAVSEPQESTARVKWFFCFPIYCNRKMLTQPLLTQYDQDITHFAKSQISSKCITQEHYELMLQFLLVLMISTLKHEAFSSTVNEQQFCCPNNRQFRRLNIYRITQCNRIGTKKHR